MHHHPALRQGYETALARSSSDGALYAGINAATTALLLGDSKTATTIAKNVAQICEGKPDRATDYWALATLGECALIGEKFKAAQEHYRAAVELAGNRYADIASTRRNAALLLRFQDRETSVLRTWLPIPKVAVFTGHLMDLPGKPMRFPHSQIDAVQSELRRIVSETHVGFGYSAAACGGDLLFLDVVRETDGETHVVLPLQADLFWKTSVTVDTQQDWEPNYKRALESAAHVTIVNDFSRAADALQFEYTNRVMTGLALLHARSLGTEIVPVAVWDGMPARGPGGTGELVQLWKRLGWNPRVINPMAPNAEIDETTEAYPSNHETTESVSEFDKEIRAMLFADVVGYSKITEEEIPLFVREFMHPIAKSVRDSGVTVETGNTWGDAIYFVFRDVKDAGLTALRISELISSIDWVAHGFKRQLNLRTGLHVGPVYRFIDPVTQISTHTGAHVSRAARIEPITPPGEVYASEAFAAVAAAENVTEFQCDYVGLTPMAKGYGKFPTYHVRRCSS